MRCAAAATSPPLCIAATNSPALGKRGSRLAVAKTGADASITSGATCSDISVTSSGKGSSVDKSISVVSGSWWILAATSVMVAPANAGWGTNDNSSQSAAAIIITPSSSNLKSVGFTPTETESSTPSAASTRASSPRAVVDTLAVKYMAVSSAVRSVTRPMAWVESWLM